MTFSGTFYFSFSISLSLSLSWTHAGMHARVYYLSLADPDPSALLFRLALSATPFPSYPFISLIVPTSCPNAIKLLDARRANRETSLTVVVIAGACRVSRCKSSLCLP